MNSSLSILLGLSLALAGCFSSTVDEPRGPKSADGVAHYPDGWLGDDLTDGDDDEDIDESDEDSGVRPIDEGDDDEDIDEAPGDDDEGDDDEGDDDEGDDDEEPVEPRPTGGTTGLLTGVWERVAIESAWGDRIESVGGDFLVFDTDTIAFGCDATPVAYSTSGGTIEVSGFFYEWLIVELLESRFTYMDGDDTYFYERRESCP